MNVPGRATLVSTRTPRQYRAHRARTRRARTLRRRSALARCRLRALARKRHRRARAVFTSASSQHRRMQQPRHQRVRVHINSDARDDDNVCECTLTAGARRGVCSAGRLMLQWHLTAGGGMVAGHHTRATSCSCGAVSAADKAQNRTASLIPSFISTEAHDGSRPCYHVLT